MKIDKQKVFAHLFGFTGVLFVVAALSVMNSLLKLIYLMRVMSDSEFTNKMVYLFIIGTLILVGLIYLLLRLGLKLVWFPVNLKENEKATIG